MKNLVLAIALICCGCGYSASRVTDSRVTEDNKLELKGQIGSYQVLEFEYDGCQYVAITCGKTGDVSITHKGNCKYCRQKNK